MSLINLTKNLENFKWTSYEKAGEGKSPQQDGTNYFARPNPKSLEQMESKFGKLDTQPDTRGPYGVSNNMDGTKQGRGFIQPGSTPSGFSKNMDLLHNKSEFEIGGDLTLTPLSYTVAGVISNLFYGQVDKKELNIEPQAEGAYGVTTLPISTYSSRQPIEGIPVGAIGGSNTYYGNLDLLSSRNSKFQKPDGSYTTPEEPLFEGGQRTFLIPAAYPDNTTAYSINTQFGWTHQSNYLESHGAAWRGFKLVDTVGGQMNSSGTGHPHEDSGLPHPTNKIYLNSEPAYGAPSYLRDQFLINHGVTGGIWPYKVLGFTGTHPLIRKDIGERMPAGGGLSDWITTQAQRTSEDFERIQGWLGTPAGEIWIGKQNILQELNPREETRQFSLDSLLTSLPPFIHGKRHITAFGGETYMDVADFGPLFDDSNAEGGLASIIAGKWPTLAGNLKKAEAGMDWLSSGLSSLGSALGMIDFHEEGMGGRLRFLQKRFIGTVGITNDSFLTFSNPFDGKQTENMTTGAGHVNLTSLMNSAAPFGRPPKIPTQTVFSQKGAFGRGAAHKELLGMDGSPLQTYKTLSYGQLGSNSKYTETFTPGEVLEAQKEANAAVDLEDKIADIVDTLQKPGAGTPSHKLNEAWEKYDKATTDRQKAMAILEHKKHNIKRDTDIVSKIGDPGNKVGEAVIDEAIGKIRKNEKYNSTAVDKVNMLAYGQDYTDPATGKVSDFVKFKFKDLVNNKFIIFRAILSGISDSITPEWSGTRYIGRPDNVYVYTGAERKVNFTFSIYPKTKQEFPVLLEKLNYLVGLCYPTYTENNRMIAPFIQLTLGDMFKDTPGFLDTLSVNVDDTSTWEIDEGLQFPKHITCDCGFTYVGKYLPSTLGKHYELNWLDDKGWSKQDGKPTTKGTLIDDNIFPERTHPVQKIFTELGAVNPATEG
jgi:hypothetical protein